MDNSKSVVLTQNGTIQVNTVTPTETIADKIMQPNPETATVTTEVTDIFTQPMTKEEIFETLENSRKQKVADEIKANENTTTVKLPSNGLINPKITEVTLKRMSTKQAKALFTSNDPNYLTTLLLSCIIEPTNLTANDLHSNDVVYLLFILRYISSPKTLVQKVNCQNLNCRHSYDEAIKINELKVNYADPEKYEFKCKLPDKGDIVEFKILSEGELINCENIANRKIKQENIPAAEEDWTRIISKISYMIVRVNDKEFDTFNEKLDYLENLSYYDFEYFNETYNKIINSFGVERKIVSTCPECGNTNEVYVYISPEFFRLI